MADEKLTALTATTDIADDSLLYVVLDPTTVPLSRKMSFSNFYVELALTPKDGWIPLPSTDSWTAASTTDPYTITVPAGAESIYDKGDKVRLKQGGGYKYFYIYGTTDALLDVTGGSDYALTTDAITDVYYSKIENPLDFPHWFNLTAPVFEVAYFDDGAGGQPTTTIFRMSIDGNACDVHWDGSGTKAGTNQLVFAFPRSAIPAVANATNGSTLLGTWAYGQTLSGSLTVNDATTIRGYAMADIADNAGLANASFVMRYEI